MQGNDIFMLRACRIAFLKYGKTSPNPPVGAVIVRDGEILGEGGTGPYGCEHAEVFAIKDAISRGHNLAGADIYVTLEPCSHYGKTPPCTEAIISSGIKRVYIALLDPNPVVAGSGVEKLRAGGIEIGYMRNFSAAAFDLLRSFKKLILTGKPYIINKCAMTLDGRIASSSGDSKWISNEHTRFFVHKLRSRVDAVIIGKNTLLHDNPMLNVRAEDFSIQVRDYLSDCDMQSSGRRNFFINELLHMELTDSREPLRVLIGMPDDIPEKFNFFRDNNYIIIADESKYISKLKNNDSLREAAGKLNIYHEKFDGPDNEIDFALDVMKKMGVMTALLEGGGSVNGSFFSAGAIDQFMYVIAPKVIGDGISPVNGGHNQKISDSLILNDITVVNIAGDLLYNGYREKFSEVKAEAACLPD